MKFESVPKWDWPPSMPEKLQKVFKNQNFLVQLFDEGNGVTRMTVNRTAFNPKTRRWHDNITWDELQEIKDSVGFFDFDAIEIYPSKQNIVNVANMRHLWILPDPHPMTWRELK